MKKEILVGLLAIGFIFVGVISASAGVVTWTLVEDASYASEAPVSRSPHPLLCTGTSTATDLCNMTPQQNCKVSGTPSKGSCSYSELTFAMASSCATGNTGQSCTTNTECGGPSTPCVPCNPPAQVGLTYFGLNSDGGTKGQGYYDTLACDNGFSVTAVSIGTSEVVTHVGGSCMTIAGFNSASGCGVGNASTDYDLDLWTSTTGSCGFPAGEMPGLALAGKIMSATSTASTCGYSTTELDNIASTKGLGSGDYLSVMCGSGNLPTDLLSVCIPGAAWQAVIVASTDAAIGTECASACPSSCMAGTAEDVE